MKTLVHKQTKFYINDDGTLSPYERKGRSKIMIHDYDKWEYKWGSPEDGNAMIIKLSENQEINRLKKNKVNIESDKNELKTHM